MRRSVVEAFFVSVACAGGGGAAAAAAVDVVASMDGACWSELAVDIVAIACVSLCCQCIFCFESCVCVCVKPFVVLISYACCDVMR